jgi:prefoldin subunit 5
MSEKKQLIKVLEIYEDRVKSLMNDMTRLYLTVEHLHQSLDVTIDELKEELKKEDLC